MKEYKSLREIFKEDFSKEIDLFGVKKQVYFEPVKVAYTVRRVTDKGWLRYKKFDMKQRTKVSYVLDKILKYYEKRLLTHNRYDELKELAGWRVGENDKYKILVMNWWEFRDYISEKTTVRSNAYKMYRNWWHNDIVFVLEKEGKPKVIVAMELKDIR